MDHVKTYELEITKAREAANKLRKLLIGELVGMEVDGFSCCCAIKFGKGKIVDIRITDSCEYQIPNISFWSAKIKENDKNNGEEYDYSSDLSHHLPKHRITELFNAYFGNIDCEYIKSEYFKKYYKRP